VVRGRWWGDVDISSVHCDLFEGNENSQRSTRWWDRPAAASMDWSEKTFSQNFVEADGRNAGEPIDPASEYSVACSAYFSEGWPMGATSPVGVPSTGWADIQLKRRTFWPIGRAMIWSVLHGFLGGSPGPPERRRRRHRRPDPQPPRTWPRGRYEVRPGGHALSAVEVDGSCPA
jgi:hypothetical protein